MKKNKDRGIIINEIIMPDKRSFMKISTLAYELDVSEDTIEKWVKESFLLYEVHYFIRNNVKRYYFPAIMILLLPKAANDEI
jgi:hypothetical protein